MSTCHDGLPAADAAIRLRVMRVRRRLGPRRLDNAEAIPPLAPLVRASDPEAPVGFIGSALGSSHEDRVAWCVADEGTATRIGAVCLGGSESVASEARRGEQSDGHGELGADERISRS